MKVIVLGAGMYVTGREDSGNGTVLASLIQLSKKIKIEKIAIIARKKGNKIVVDKAASKIKQLLGNNVIVEYQSIKEGTSLAKYCKREKFTCGIVVTPDHTHFKLIKILLELQIHVLCAKPLVNTLNENIELIKLQQKNKVLGFVEFHKRYDEANLYTKKIVRDGAIGDVLYYTVDYSQRISIPQETFHAWVDKTNIFQYLGVHYVDLFYFITDFKPIRLMSYGTRGKLARDGIDTYDSVHSSIIWKNKNEKECITTFNTNWIDPNSTSALSDQKYKLIGTNGRIENNHKDRGIELVSDKQAIQHPNPYFSEFLPNPNSDFDFHGYGYKSIKQFINDVLMFNQGKISQKLLDDNRPSFKQALVSTAILENVNKSLNNNANWYEINV